MAKVIKRNTMWYSDFTQDGKRIRRALSPYKPKAEELLKDLLQIRTSQKDGSQPKDVSWFFFKEKYLKYSMLEKDPGTYDHDLRAFNMVDKYGRPLVRLQQMSPEYLEDFGFKCRAKKISERTASDYIRRMKTAMHKAEEWKLISAQSWGTVETVPDGKRVEYFLVEQFRHVVSLCQGHWRTAALLMGLGGQRSGEARNLEWSDVDFKNHLIEIRVKEDWRPKGSKGVNLKERKVDMLPELETYLQSLPKDTRYVLGPELIQKHTYKRYFIRLSNMAGCKVFPHKFRHTFASFMISSGATLDEVGEMLGQSDPRSTKIYAHMMPHARRASMDRMQAMLVSQMPQAPMLQVVQAGA